MAVFTSVTKDEVSEWLRPLGAGALVELQGIAAGIENTNYFVTTDRGRYVLTIFEKLTPAELPFYLGMMGHLAARGIRCPAPIAAADGRLFSTLKGKPAALVTRLAGAAVMQPAVEHCAALGGTLADMHGAAAGYAGTLENPRGPDWWRETAPKVAPFLDAPRRALLEAELAFQSRCDRRDLPRGPIHADLFRDNVLFETVDGASRVGGVIDFYFAGVDAFLFDVAVTLNDWCIDHASGAIQPDKARAFLAAYAGRRAFTASERAAWPAMLRAAALRFWLSRLYDFYLPRTGELIHAHDPEHFHRILALRAAAAAPPPL